MDTPEQFTAYISKYALSVGIKTIVAEVSADGVVYNTANRWQEFYHGEGREWHRTRESAVADAEARRVAKIASLKKQITKLEKLRFE